ncbi:MAG: hypothetical protein HOG89_00935 [Candidatus Peribacter sp.]|jgi:hypothetical protein|nr:hypothetical protein [Candidatus Peribacter sp.]MBT4392913.1 hypothetical protein [Candidatus Peribacter sp.]MBT4600973.1 hypothetical protein [Candidatus Peribacter sp.]MBT5149014.1 hypothetical protein [Candidatus Peribacter sp.]MBT5637339.1 hypothetical protein [Candidatus Peribacter sp.]
MSFKMLIAALALFPMCASAHIPLNMGTEEPDPNMPAIPQEYSAPPMADIETQQMALDIENADCEKLNAMDHDVKHAFLITHIFLQRPGALSKIVGPDCTFLGEVEEIAAITDDALTLSAKRELLYYLPEMNALIVSNKEEDTIAYGLILDEEIPPLEYFLSHRNEAERNAAIARSYSILVEDITLPTFDPNDAPVLREESNTASSAKPRAQAVRSRSREDTTSSSAAPFVPTGTDTPPGFTPPEIEDSVIPPSDPIAKEQDDFAGIGDIVYVDTPSDALPDIEPLGPVPEPEESSQGIGYWIFMIFLALILIATGVVVIRSQASAKKGMMDE